MGWRLLVTGTVLVVAGHAGPRKNVLSMRSSRMDVDARRAGQLSLMDLVGDMVSRVRVRRRQKSSCHGCLRVQVRHPRGSQVPEVPQVPQVPQVVRQTGHVVPYFVVRSGHSGPVRHCGHSGGRRALLMRGSSFLVMSTPTSCSVEAQQLLDRKRRPLRHFQVLRLNRDC